MAIINKIQQSTYSIGVVARLTGISTHRLRVWERRYGLGPTKRTEGGQREYSRLDLDHMYIIKELLDDGMRIGDISKLPKKTLTGLIRDNHDNARSLATEPLNTVVIGTRLQQHFFKHNHRYPQLHVLSPKTVSIQETLDDLSAHNIRSLIIEVKKITQAVLKPLLRQKANNLSVCIVYQNASQEIINEVEKQGIQLLHASFKLSDIDNWVRQTSKQQHYMSELFNSMGTFNIPMTKLPKRHFSYEQLNEAKRQSTLLERECPRDISVLIQSLNKLEDYSQQCSANSWKQATIHACVYAYTMQARHLMEKALVAVQDNDEDHIGLTVTDNS